MKTQAKTALFLIVVAAAGFGCSAVLGIDSDRHVVATPLSEDAGTPTVDAGVWWCENDPVPEASAGPVKVAMFVDDVSTASSQNSFAGNPIPGALVVACSTLDIPCASPVATATANDAGIALITVPSQFSGYYQLTANGFTPAISSRTPQLTDESVQQGMPTSR